MAWIEFCCCKHCDASMDGDVLDEYVGSDFCGIPMILLFGDCHQLAPVIGFSHLKSHVGKDGLCDELGRMVFSEFLDPKDNRVESYSFNMDTVMKQDDGDLLRVLDRMRRGKLQMEDAEYLLERDINNL